MIKESKVSKYGEVKIHDMFMTAVKSCNKDGTNGVNVYVGKNLALIVVSAKDTILTTDDKIRIDKLINDTK